MTVKIAYYICTGIRTGTNTDNLLKYIGQKYDLYEWFRQLHLLNVALNTNLYKCSNNKKCEFVLNKAHIILELSEVR